TLTVLVGKTKPYFAFEEWLGSGNQQFVEYGMSEWMFDADDDNLAMMASVQLKAMDDRLWVTANILNGNESQFPNTQMDNLPGFTAAYYSGFGGSWNADRQRWNFYGDSASDINYSCKPFVRIGAMKNIVLQNRRSLYGDLKQSRVFTMPGGPGGTRIINLLNG